MTPCMALPQQLAPPAAACCPAAFRASCSGGGWLEPRLFCVWAGTGSAHRNPILHMLLLRAGAIPVCSREQQQPRKRARNAGPIARQPGGKNAWAGAGLPTTSVGPAPSTPSLDGACFLPLMCPACIAAAAAAGAGGSNSEHHLMARKTCSLARNTAKPTVTHVSPARRSSCALLRACGTANQQPPPRRRGSIVIGGCRWT